MSYCYTRIISSNNELHIIDEMSSHGIIKPTELSNVKNVWCSHEILVLDYNENLYVHENRKSKFMEFNQVMKYVKKLDSGFITVNNALLGRSCDEIKANGFHLYRTSIYDNHFLDTPQFNYFKQGLYQIHLSYQEIVITKTIKQICSNKSHFNILLNDNQMLYISGILPRLSISNIVTSRRYLNFIFSQNKTYHVNFFENVKCYHQGNELYRSDFSNNFYVSY